MTACLRWALTACIAAAPVLAHAANGNIPRTPPVFPPHACLGVVDRSVDPVFAFKVGIPFEDAMLTDDELPDSRTFEFFGLCHDDPRGVVLPNWVRMDDAERALAAGNIDALPDASDVLDGHPSWTTGHDGAASCVQTTGERVPITCAATEDGLAWDTTGVPAGNYVIRGYTFSPPTNLWTPRSGVVQVHDGMPLPVVAFASPIYDAKVFQASGYRVRGCMGGPAGTRVTLAWAAIADLDMDDPSVWTDFAELDAGDGAFEVLLVPPESAIYAGLVLRGTASADVGAPWVGYAPGLLTIYPGDEASDDPEVPPGPDRCEVGEEPTAGLELPETTDGSSDGGDTAGDDSAQDDSSQGDGCGCRARAGEHMGTIPLILLLCAARVLTAVRRRARARRPARVADAGPAVPQ